jgi:hypothetical protein
MGLGLFHTVSLLMHAAQFFHLLSLIDRVQVAKSHYAFAPL